MSIDLEARAHSDFVSKRSKVQRTLRSSISCVGVGLHSGAKVALSLYPAEAGSGIQFVRKDQVAEQPVRALFDQVCDTTMCTTIGRSVDGRVCTIEHLMAALAALEIDNVLIEVDGPEVPIMDGSSQPVHFPDRVRWDCRTGCTETVGGNPKAGRGDRPWQERKA